MSIFNDIEKDIMYEVLQKCAIDYAKIHGEDEKNEDVILINKFLENITRFDLVEAIVDKLKEKGYQISQKT